MSATQVPTQSQVKFEKCLIVSRHQMLKSQEDDVKQICGNINVVPELPTDQQKLKEVIQQYDAVIGVLPIQLQVQILQAKKYFLTFVMTSLGVFSTKEDAEKKASQYPNRAVILPPSKEGEKYRVTLYQGMKLIREIKVVDEWVIQHSS